MTKNVVYIRNEDVKNSLVFMYEQKPHILFPLYTSRPRLEIN